MGESENPGRGALAGVRVIDLTRVLGGPYATQILADHGADVIKVEPPQGDETRDWGPPFRDGAASYFVGVNRSKRMLALDLAKADGRDVLLRLLDSADVLVHNFKSGTLERWGLGYDQLLRERYPRLVYCQITGFGDDGPLGGLPGYDAAVQAVSGLMSINGLPETGPLRMGTPVVDLASGLNVVIGVVLALYDRERTGAGQAIDIALLDSAVSLLHPQGANYLMSGTVPGQLGNAHPNISPYDCFRTGTRPIFLAVGNDRQFRIMCELMEAPQLPDDPRFADNAGRLEHRDELRAELEELFAAHDGEQLADNLMRSGVPAGAVHDVAEVLESDQARHRDLVVEDGEYRGIGFPVKLSRSTPALQWGPRSFDADGPEILREIGYSDTEISRLQASGVVPVARRT
jgi:crotonobetainyl-CoA:carnitine CoA-transferase CaiB-like acyl-CoA transferase